PFEKQLGAIDPAAFSTSFLIQPLLFIRTRPGKKDKVAARLEEQGVAHQIIGEDCIALPNTTNLEDVLVLNRDAVIQDKNSQRVFDELNPEWLPAGKVAVWDCCAASGGKSILLNDKLAGKMNLTVSDIRPNILYNCKKRLAEAGININNAFIADVAAPLSPDEVQEYDIIICDAPCSGSGTWSRTPEQLAGFSKDRIAAFSALQKSIAKNTSTQLKSGGLFIYITCSVFKEENESVVAAIDEQTELAVLQQEYLSGYEQQADTMFVAIFKKL
ncbi:MAG: methyltransferase domain-containing protein, partial [Chitinophagaceae bacterium]